MGKQKGTITRNYALCIFIISLKTTIENFNKKNKKDPTPEQIEQWKSALLNEESIAGHVAKAERMILTAQEEWSRTIVVTPQKNKFWISVIASMVGAFLYSLLLLIIYLLIVMDIDLSALIRSIGRQ